MGITKHWGGGPFFGYIGVYIGVLIPSPSHSIRPSPPSSHHPVEARIDLEASLALKGGDGVLNVRGNRLPPNLNPKPQALNPKKTGP